MGKVNASIASQRLLSEYAVQALFFTGIAGGLNPHFAIGDIVIAGKTFQHDFGMLAEEFTLRAVGTLPELGIGQADAEIKYDLQQHWPDAADFWLPLQHLAKHLPKPLQAIQLPTGLYQPQLHCNATVATGDQFVMQRQKQQQLWGLGADLVEMEGAAVAQVAARQQKPCFLLRAVSDKADSNAKFDARVFIRTVAANNAMFFATLFQERAINRYLQQLIA